MSQLTKKLASQLWKNNTFIVLKKLVSFRSFLILNQKPAVWKKRFRRFRNLTLVCNGCAALVRPLSREQDVSSQIRINRGKMHILQQKNLLFNFIFWSQSLGITKWVGCRRLPNRSIPEVWLRLTQGFYTQFGIPWWQRQKLCKIVNLC